MESQAIVLMPYYQTERSLFGKSLQSFLDQDYQNKKLVIYIDNDKKNENDLNSILDNLDEKQKKAYDVQVFIKKNKEDDKFPVIAYRHQGGDHYSFTKDR